MDLYVKPDLTEADTEAPDNLLYSAWVVIANVSGGDWSKQSDEWREAATKWRDEWHSHLDAVAEVEQVTVTGHGLWYIHRNGQNCDGLARDLFDGRSLHRPERDVAIALLKYALGKLELANETKVLDG